MINSISGTHIFDYELSGHGGSVMLTMSVARNAAAFDPMSFVAPVASDPDEFQGSRQSRSMREGCINRHAVAACVSTFLLALAACWVLGGSESRGIASGWVMYQLAGPLDLSVLPLRAPTPLLTHEPYATQPPSFLASPHYQAICAPSDPQQPACSVGAYNASGPGRLPPCTPDSLRRWSGDGSWFKDSDGHYRCAPDVLDPRSY